MMKTKTILLGILMLMSFSIVTWAQVPVRAITGFTAGTPIKGMPYSAESNTEFIRVLIDGNRIIRKTRIITYRDSEGRTRVENYSKPESPDIYITDPVANVAYVLNPRLKTATRLPLTANRYVLTLNSPNRAVGTGTSVATFNTSAPVVITSPTVTGSPATTSSATTTTTITSTSPSSTYSVVTSSADVPATSGSVTFSSTTFSSTLGSLNGYATKSEPLGTRTIEGVETEGTRRVTTIAPGIIGNEKAIESVSETWYSKDLRITVLSKSNDPQSGDYTTQLTNIKRDEPDKSLFTVPVDYKITGITGAATVSKPE